MNKKEKEFIELLKKYGLRKELIEVFKKTDQRDFFDRIFSGYYYSQEQIPIGNAEKSDPSDILARMINFLPEDKNSRVLEVGTGSGYSTVILSRLYKEVVTVEYHEELAIAAKNRLQKLKITNVKFLAGDITDIDSLPGSFDGIIVLAACQARPLFLIPYLKDKGTMVFPMGPLYQQQVTVLKNEPGEKESMYRVGFHDLCCFTPLKGS